MTTNKIATRVEVAATSGKRTTSAGNVYSMGTVTVEKMGTINLVARVETSTGLGVATARLERDEVKALIAALTEILN